MLEVAGALTHDLFITISFPQGEGPSSRTAPNCFTEMFRCFLGQLSSGQLSPNQS